MQNKLISQIHTGPQQFAFALTGGGSYLLPKLLGVPGASKTVLEVHIPYSRASFDSYLGRKPLNYCSLWAALDLAKEALKRGDKSSESSQENFVFGFGLTASLTSLEKKKGPCRFFMACEGKESSHVFSCFFSKEFSSRQSQEEFIAHCAEILMAKVCKIPGDFPQSSNEIVYKEIEPRPEWLALEKEALPFFQSNKVDSHKLIFSGSFNCLHKGHIMMKKLAENHVGLPLSFELSLANADKSKLSFFEVSEVVAQFEGKYPYLLTKAPTFTQKARLFPGATFVIGFDTLVRIFEAKFYQGEEQMEKELHTFIDYKVQFLVFGRKISTGFQTLSDFPLPLKFRALFHEIPEKDFRNDISSTQLRKNPNYFATGVFDESY